MSSGKRILVSVADVIGRDPNTLEALFFGKTLITSAFTTSLTATEIWGGKGNVRQFIFYHDKKVDIKIDDATFNKTIIALNAGTSILNGTKTVVATDCIVLSSGSGTLLQTPTSSTATIFMPDGTVQNVSIGVSGSFVVAGGTTQRVDAVYTTTATADSITIGAYTPPTLVDLTLLADIRDDTNTIVEKLQIHVPRFQVSGNYNLAFTANAASTNALEGGALVSAATDCSGTDYLAELIFVPVSGTAIPVSNIAAVPGELVFSAAATPQSKQITALGIRGSLYANANLTTSASFVVSGSQVGNFSVGLHTGIVTSAAVTSASAVATILVTYVDATYGTLTDTVRITATA
jgi:hypothetical protein